MIKLMLLSLVSLVLQVAALQGEGIASAIVSFFALTPLLLLLYSRRRAGVILAYLALLLSNMIILFPDSQLLPQARLIPDLVGVLVVYFLLPALTLATAMVGASLLPFGPSILPAFLFGGVSLVPDMLLPLVGIAVPRAAYQAQIGNCLMLDIASLIGSHSLSLILAVSSFIGASLLVRRETARAVLQFIVVVMIAAIGRNWKSPEELKIPPEAKQLVALNLIQPNVSHLLGTTASQGNAIDSMIGKRLTSLCQTASAKATADLTVFPEQMYGRYLLSSDLLEDLCRMARTSLLIGTRTFERGVDFNSVALIGPACNVIHVRNKVNLIPFYENRFGAGRRYETVIRMSFSSHTQASGRVAAYRSASHAWDCSAWLAS